MPETAQTVQQVNLQDDDPVQDRMLMLTVPQGLSWLHPQGCKGNVKGWTTTVPTFLHAVSQVAHAQAMQLWG